MLKKFFTVLIVVAMVILAFSTSVSANGISYGKKEDSIDWDVIRKFWLLIPMLS
ncbi:MAG TPA: hypothetical protein VIG73_12850 [Cerasibacillus sp.]|uniref:hypothetical protein n=1 Tax=Cerasibacillus sp. TaxID=2498711 RepID=UPI002F405E57